MSEFSEAGVCGIDGCGPAGDKRTDSVTATKNSPDVQIEVVSDAICPWCYVAKRNLDAAAAELRKNFSVDVKWLPFELNADMPKGGLDRKKYRSAKFGSWEHSQRLDAHVTEAGKAAGLDFHHERMERTPNTFDAHRLIWLRKRKGSRTRWWRDCSPATSQTAATSAITTFWRRSLPELASTETG